MQMIKTLAKHRRLALAACAAAALGMSRANAVTQAYGYEDWVTINHLAPSFVKGELKAMDIPVAAFVKGANHWPKGWWGPNVYGYAGPVIPAWTKVRALYSHEFAADKTCPQGYMAIQPVEVKDRFEGVPAEEIPVAAVCTSFLGRIAHLDYLAKKAGSACYSQPLAISQLGFKFHATVQSKSKLGKRVLITPVAPMVKGPGYWTTLPNGESVIVNQGAYNPWMSWGVLQKRLAPTYAMAKFADYSVQYPCPVAMVMGIPDGALAGRAYSYQILEAHEQLPLDFKDRFQISTADWRPPTLGWWQPAYGAALVKPFATAPNMMFTPGGVKPFNVPLASHGMWGMGGAYAVTATRGLRVQSLPTTRSKVAGALRYQEAVQGSGLVPGPGCASGWMMIQSLSRPYLSGYVCSKHLGAAWGMGWQGHPMMNMQVQPMMNMMAPKEIMVVPIEPEEAGKVLPKE